MSARGPNRGGGGYGQPQQQSRNAPTIQFFADDGKNWHPDLLTGQADTWADYIQTTRSRAELTSHQLRRFYNDLKALEKRAREAPDDFARYWPLVGMLKAKVAYAANPKKPKIPDEFRQFIDNCVDQVQGDYRRFEAFCKFFEAVVGYLYGRGIADR